MCAAALLALWAGAAAAEPWRFRVTPYLWAAGLDGDVSTLPGAPEAAIDLSFGDILANLDAGAFVAATARRGDWLLLAEGQAVLTTQDVTTPGGRFGGGELESDTYYLTLGAGRTVWRGDAASLDLFGGARLWAIDTDLSLNAGTDPAARVSSSETFVDPVIGASGRLRLAERWTGFASATLGGFGVGSDLSAGATAAVEYAAGESWGLTAGYRILAVDYREDGFVYDVTQQGALLGVYFDF